MDASSSPRATAVARVGRTGRSNRFSGLFQSIAGRVRKKQRGVVVLIDDDERFLSELRTSIVELSDCDVVTARDGVDGLVLLKVHADEVRLCLIDMVMPGISGIETLNRGVGTVR